MKVRVPLLDRIRGFATIDTDATPGATLGVDLRTREGRVLTEAEVLNPAVTSEPGGATPGVSIWRLLLEIPANVKALAAAVGQGFFAITGDGTGAMRTLQPGAGVSITDGDGIDGDPVIAHADTSSAPSLASDNSGGVVLQDVFLTFDQFGHVTGAAAATVNLDGRFPRYYDHLQSSASDTWTINHNLGYRPSVELRTVGGVEFNGDVTHTSDNQVVVSLTSPLAGTARLI